VHKLFIKANMRVFRSGLVESKLRHLVSKLEMLENVQLAHPFNKGFDSETDCSTEEEAIKFAHGESIVADTNETSDSDNKIKVFTTSFYVGLVLDISMCGIFDSS
jgi:poly(A) polymerase